MLRKSSILAVILGGLFSFVSPQAVLPDTWGVDQVFVAPEAGRYPYLTIIHNTDKTLDIVAYRLSDPEIIRALQGAVQRGVRVRLLLEPAPEVRDATESTNNIQQLKDAGIQVTTPSKRFTQTHQKMIIADGKWALISTGDMDKETFDGGKTTKPTRDFAIPVGDLGLVREMTRVFQADLQDQRMVPKETPLVWGPEQTRNILLSLINLAAKRIWIYNPDIRDDGLVRALEGAAKDGVDVRLMMPPFPFNADKDYNIPKQRRLVAAGAKVHLLQDPTSHAKVLMVDDTKAYVGSANLFHKSLDGARELGVIISQPKQLTLLRKTFELDWKTSKNFVADPASPPK